MQSLAFVITLLAISARNGVKSEAEALWDKLPGATNHHHVQSAKQQKMVSPPGIGGFWGTIAGSDRQPQMEKLSEDAPISSQRRYDDIGTSSPIMQKLAQLLFTKQKKQKPHGDIHRVLDHKISNIKIMVYA